MFQLTRSKIIAGAAVALLGAYSAVAGFAAPGVPVDSPACEQQVEGCTEVEVPGSLALNLPDTATAGIAGAEANRPEDLTLGPPEGLPLGPQDDLPDLDPEDEDEDEDDDDEEDEDED